MHDGRFSSPAHRLRPVARILAAPRGQALVSLLASDDLRSRFYSWRGASGRRYVCSVFQRGEEGFVADVDNGLIIGVAADGSALRPLCVLSARDMIADIGAGRRRSLREMAHEMGVAQWHVHFCADGEALRDLAASLLN